MRRKLVQLGLGAVLLMVSREAPVCAQVPPPRLTDDGLKSLAAAKNTKVFDLSNSDVTDTGLKELAHRTNLKMILLTETRVAVFLGERV